MIKERKNKDLEEEVMVPDLEFRDKVIKEGADTLNLCFMCGTCTGRSEIIK